MSPVQQKVLTELPSLTADCIVQAKTGTGKTVAFLLPALQNLLAGNMPRRGHVGILVICPTRELAQQIAKEAEGVMACLPRKLECHTAFGGTARASALKRFLNGDPTILVATPGRLADILDEEEVRRKMTDLQTVILDEADRMLDQGFAPAVRKILSRLPAKSTGWQGMCFSATMTKDVMEVAKCVLKPDYTKLSTVDPNEVPTHARVPQFSVVVPDVPDTFAALLAVIKEEQAEDKTKAKIIVFGTTANGVGLLHELFKAALPHSKVFELHSRLSQSARTRITAEFKDTENGVLFASDVVGRGIDFPNVTSVIQVGLPSEKDQYVHRVGRTARAGKDGRAVIILTDRESFFLRTNKDLTINPYPSEATIAQVSSPPSLTNQANIRDAMLHVEEGSKEQAYRAFLGYNKTFLKKLRLEPAELVALANRYALSMGLPEPPMLEAKTVGKMGLKGVPGLRIGHSSSSASGPPRNRHPR
jgi:ATP-dependent RNA helicase MSS116